MDLNSVMESVVGHLFEQALRSVSGVGPSRADLLAPSTASSAKHGDGEKSKKGAAAAHESPGRHRREITGKHEEKEKHAVSTAPSYTLNKCRKIATSFWGGKAASELEDQQNGSSRAIPSSSAASALNPTVDMYTRKVDEIANDTTKSPGDKMMICRDDLNRLLAVQPIEWRAVQQLLSMLSALTRMCCGEWSLDVATVEYDMAVCYCAQGCIEAALSHIDESRMLMNEVRVERGELAHWLDLLEAACLLMLETPKASKAVRRAVRAKSRLLKQHSSLPEDDPMLFPYQYIHMCALFEDSSDHHEALQMMEKTLACAVDSQREQLLVTVTRVAMHCRLLARADAELGSAPITAAREKLLEMVRQAKTQAELQDINAKLRNDVEALESKRQSHEALVIRQVDRIVEALRDGLKPICAAAAEGRARYIEEKLVAGLAYIGARACWRAFRTKEASMLMHFAVEAQNNYLPEHLLGLLLFNSGELDIGSEVHRSAVSSYDLHTIAMKCLRPLERDLSPNALPADWTPLRQFCGLAEALERRGRGGRASDDSSNSDSSEDDQGQHGGGDSTAEMMRVERGLKSMESALIMLQRHYGAHSKPVADVLLALERGYAQCNRSADELAISALIADAFATALGPTHHQTLKVIKSYAMKQKRVHPPLINPSWGVHPMLTRVDLKSDTKGADIYFTLNGEMPTEDIGVNGTMKYSPMDPIVLDTIGRVKVRAFSTKDGIRSGEVVAQFSVVQK